METTKHLTQKQIRDFREDGYLLMEGLFAPEEVRELVDNFMEMHSGGPIPGCFEPADPDVSFTRDYVPVPEGLEAVPVVMRPGDVRFFNGQLVHGSQLNSSENRFRRSFICHYLGRSSERISKWYRPILTMDGEEVRIEESNGGGSSGTEDVGVH